MKKYFLTTQFRVGSYSIDIAILDATTKEFILGIEVDEYKYHSGYEKRIRDIERQMFIEAKGYKPVYRITELDWKTNPSRSLKEIKELLY